MRGDGVVHHALPAAVGAQLGAHEEALLPELSFPIALGVGEAGSLGAARCTLRIDIRVLCVACCVCYSAMHFSLLLQK